MNGVAQLLIQLISQVFAAGDDDMQFHGLFRFWRRIYNG
jgi:hypothetical protein